MLSALRQSLAASSVTSSLGKIGFNATRAAASRGFAVGLTHRVPMDGNQAAAHVAYHMNDCAGIYPITPSSPIAEHCAVWAAAKRKNMFGQIMDVTEMQSEAGAAGAVHGMLAGGALATTFTSSQGLLLMMPNMYKIAGENLPGTFHVAARAVARHALSIYGDHDDVMGTRPAGFGLLASSSVQECMDLAVIAQLATVQASLPMIHFFEGFRLSHEINTIEMVDTDIMTDLADFDAIQRFRDRALNPGHPHLTGSAQGPEVYMQMCEASNNLYAAFPEKVQAAMDSFGSKTGRKYNLFDYYGHKDAEEVVVIAGAGGVPAQQVVDYLNKNGRKTGVIQTRLFRPFSLEHFMSKMPRSVQKIAVLDRTKEPGALGEPLYADTVMAMHEADCGAKVYGGRYGLGSKDFTPAMVEAVFNNLRQDKPANHYTVGITDDVSYKSLDVGVPSTNYLPDSVSQCFFWGIGGDGSIGANKDAIKMIVDEGSYGQGAFEYSAHKTGGLTMSHLRFGPDPINAPYSVTSCNFMAVHVPAYLSKYGAKLIERLEVGGTLLLNTPYKSMEELERNIPENLKKTIAEKKLRVFNIDAAQAAVDAGLSRGLLGGVMEAAFFKVSGVLPIEKAIPTMKENMVKAFGKKGQAIVDANHKALDNALEGVVEWTVPAEWAKIVRDPIKDDPTLPPFIRNVLLPMAHLEGDNLPTSVFPAAGVMPLGTSAYEKRGIAEQVPEWDNKACTECMDCVVVCPHAAVRPVMISPADEKAAKDSNKLSDSWVTRKKMRGNKKQNFRIQVSPYDCTGCGVCVEACADYALNFQPFSEMVLREAKNWDFSQTLPDMHGIKGTEKERSTPKGSALQTPLLEFSGSCGGCAQTSYIRTVTQLVGEQMVIANATGCSSIWAGSYPINPYTTTEEGRGPAWGNSLFEDNAEFGFGMAKAANQRRAALKDVAEEAINDGATPASLKEALISWTGNFGDRAASLDTARVIEAELSAIPKNTGSKLVETIRTSADMLPKQSQWIIGGDGWAYDIGYGGVDHVLASDEDVNIFVMDTEVYSNTGGQTSKATPRGSVAQFSADGKPTAKKDLAAMAMAYPGVYVASVSIGADKKQYLQALKEAEAHKGPSIIIGYATCIAHGPSGGMKNTMDEMGKAIECGYWLNFRRNPALAAEGKNPLTIDMEEPDFDKVPSFLGSETRYTVLQKQYPDEATTKNAGLIGDLKARWSHLKYLAAQQF